MLGYVTLLKFHKKCDIEKSPQQEYNIFVLVVKKKKKKGIHLGSKLA